MYVAVVMADDARKWMDFAHPVDEFPPELTALFPVPLTEEYLGPIIAVKVIDDIAAFSKRIIRFSDGHIISDEAVRR